MRTCAHCRHLRGSPDAGEETPLDVWCPIWRMRIAAPSVTGCTLFEVWEEPAEGTTGRRGDGATGRLPTAGQEVNEARQIDLEAAR
jgi:hypothetical protein